MRHSKYKSAQPQPTTPTTKPLIPGKPTRPARKRRVVKNKTNKMESLEKLGQLKLPTQGDSDIHVMTIVGQVEGHVVLPPQNKTTKYEHLIPQLVAVEQNPKIKGLMLILNTVGGDVEAGLAIAEMVGSMSKPTVAVVLGGGHSIGIPIAVAADKSLIAETATMTIHPIRLTGLVIGVPQTYEYLDKMQQRVVDFVVKHSKVKRERYNELMFKTGELARDIGTVLVGEEAVKCGLMDEVAGVSRAIQLLQELSEKGVAEPSVDTTKKGDV